MVYKPALCILEDATIIEGVSVGVDGSVVGECVFNTSMTGYQEIMTDPSYANQIVTFTNAHIGNTGYNLEDFESNIIWAKAFIMRECSENTFHYKAQGALPNWFKEQNIMAISGIDTRYLTLKLRDAGVMAVCITTDIKNIDKALSQVKNFNGIIGQNLTSQVSRKTIERWDDGSHIWHSENFLNLHIVVYDFGVKTNILRLLNNLGCNITVVPANTKVHEVLDLNPDGIVLSNGPGDPEACYEAIMATKALLDKDIPIFGICLGCQILGLALGAKTKKMKFGHHGANHSVLSLIDKKVFITSQNHGFCIDEETIPDDIIITHKSLFDNSIQGIKHKDKKAFGFQGHPEASPGPHDILFMFKSFIETVSKGECLG